MNKNIIEAMGWYGMIAIVVAYALVSFSMLSSESIYYQLLNGTGAIGIVIVAFNKKDYQPGMLNLIWAFIAFFAILKIIF